MASTIKLKTGTGSAVPSALAQGEVGINIDNGLIYYGSGSGNSVKQLESFTHITASGNISASGIITALSMSGDGSSLTNISATLPSGVISGSAQIASDISGSFTAVSAALASDIASAGGGTTTNALTVDDTTLQLNSGTTFDGSAARTISIKDGGVDSDALAAHIAVTSITASAISASGEISATSLDISGDVDIDGTLEADVITVNGTALSTVIASTSVANAASSVNTTNANIRATTDDADFFVTVVDGATGNQRIESSTKLKFNPSNGNLFVDGPITASGNISSSGTITANSLTGNGLSIDGSSNSHIEVGEYNVGFDIIGSNTLFITGSGLIISGAMADQNHHNMLKIGDIELVDVNTALSSNEFLIHNVKSVSFTSGSDGGNITTANKLFEHTGNQFDVFIGGDATSDFQVGTADIKVGGAGASQDIQVQTSGDISILSNTDVFLRIKDSNLTTDPSDLSHIVGFNTNPDGASGQNIKKIDASKIVFTTGSRNISGSVTASAFKGDGSGLTNVSATLPSGVVSGSAQIANVTLTTAAQTNITSVGNLQSLTMDGTIDMNGETLNLNGGEIDNGISIKSLAFGSTTDQDLTITSDGNITFKLDDDNDETGQSFKFQNNDTEIANLDESGNLQLDGHITASGNISSSGEIITSKLSALGDLTIDADGADIILSDGGTDFGRFKRDTSDFVIKSETNNKDIVFKGVDDSSTITALTLDMSDAGKAIFTGNISSSGDIIGNEITSSKLLITKTGASSNETLISLVGSAGVEEFSVDEDGDLTCNDINVVNRDIKGNGTTRLTLGSQNLFVGDVRVNNTTATLSLRCSDSSIVAGQTMGKISLATNDGDTNDSADIKFIATEDHSNDPNSGTKIEFRADKNEGEGDETDTLMLTLNPNTGSIIESVHQNIYDTGSTALAANSAFGDIVKFGGSTTVAGGVYYLNSSGGWSLAQANASGTATSSLAVAVGTNSTTDGMCLRGFVNPFTDPGASIGNPVYLSDTSQGRFQATAPDSTGDIVRIIGYQYGTDLIYFNPSNDFIVHA
tara:strand:- start:5368 stop:8490 length:3123 start_codon:yes stop_codon:yes gene_type:complete